MKKSLTTLVASLLLLSLMSCENNTSDSYTSSTDSSQNEEITTTITVPDTEDEEQLSFSEIVAIDNNECTVKVTGIDPDNMWGYTLNVLLENKSTDKTYMFSVESASINGVQCDPLFASEVAPAKKANEKIAFADDQFNGAEIGKYTDIELNLRVYDSNDWIADDVANQTVHIYPYGEDNAVIFSRAPQSSDNVIIENEYVTAIVTNYENDDIWGFTANLFIINHTDKNLMITADDVSVNGFMADPFYADSVLPGKCTFSSMSWSDSVFDENGITEVEEIEFNFRAYDADAWSDDDFVNELIKLNP